jgi:hypothetical protein
MIYMFNIQSYNMHAQARMHVYARLSLIVCGMVHQRRASYGHYVWFLSDSRHHPMTNIEDRPLMIMAGMCTNRKS